MKYPWPTEVTGIERIALSAQGDLQRVLRYASYITLRSLAYLFILRHIARSSRDPLWLPLSIPRQRARRASSRPQRPSKILPKPSSLPSLPNHPSPRLARSTSNVQARLSAPPRPPFESPLRNVPVFSSRKSMPSVRCSGDLKRCPRSNSFQSVLVPWRTTKSKLLPALPSARTKPDNSGGSIPSSSHISNARSWRSSLRGRCSSTATSGWRLPIISSPFQNSVTPSRWSRPALHPRLNRASASFSLSVSSSYFSSKLPSTQATGDLDSAEAPYDLPHSFRLHLFMPTILLGLWHVLDTPPFLQLDSLLCLNRFCPPLGPSLYPNKQTCVHQVHKLSYPIFSPCTCPVYSTSPPRII